MKNYNIVDFGAKVGELSTKAIQSAIDKCHAEGGGIVEISNGTFLSGTIFMKSNVNLRIEGGATLAMSTNLEDYPDFECEWDVREAPRFSARCFIYVGNCENCSITGLGTIDCMGAEFCEVNPNPEYSETDPFLEKRMIRKAELDKSIGRMIFVMKSKNITLSDFTMKDIAGGWGIWINGCEKVNVHNAKLYCCPDYPNSDGVHINCSKDVFVTDCAIHTGDDSIIVRANTNTLGQDIPCENVIIKGCTLSSHCQAIRVGWIGDGAIRNCIFSDLVISDSRDAISIVLPPYSVPGDLGRNVTRIENLSFNNIVIDRTERYPVNIVVYESEITKCEYVRNIQFNNINSKTKLPPRIIGRKNTYIEDISFTNCRFDVAEKAHLGELIRYVRNLKTDCIWNID